MKRYLVYWQFNNPRRSCGFAKGARDEVAFSKCGFSKSQQLGPYIGGAPAGRLGALF